MILADGALGSRGLLLNPAMGVCVTDEPYAVTLQVRQCGALLEVELIARSPRTQQISYDLEVTSQSTSRHRGSTTVVAGASSVLSTIRSEASGSWYVKLVIEEENRAPYEIVRGNEPGSNL